MLEAPNTPQILTVTMEIQFWISDRSQSWRIGSTEPSNVEPVNTAPVEKKETCRSRNSMIWQPIILDFNGPGFWASHMFIRSKLGLIQVFIFFTLFFLELSHVNKDANIVVCRVKIGSCWFYIIYLLGWRPFAKLGWPCFNIFSFFKILNEWH